MRWASLLAAAALSGCGPEPVGSTVHGEVTFQGKPLDEGMIVFSPAEGQPTFSGAPIKDGRYTVPAESGLAPGKYSVRISSTEGGGPATGGLSVDAPETESKERIPPEYNVQSALTVEVKESGENKFDYNIP
jgi:hypothetical protein